MQQLVTNSRQWPQPFNKAINMADIKKLKSVGICTVKGIQMTTRKALCNIKGLSEAKVEKIKEAAGKMLNVGFQTAFEYSAKRKQSEKSTKYCGIFKFGKVQIFDTNLCVDICIQVTAQLPGEDGYSGGKIIFIDTENTLVTDSQINLTSMMVYIQSEYFLSIVDSIMALFRVDFSGRGELAERQQKLAQMLSRLQKISEEYNVAVFVTNQMTADPGAGMTFQADPKKPIGGHILAHASTTRISLRKGRGEMRIAKIFDR
uniref:DNA meiotic recombinase 1 n=1 Tax=Sphaeramia orbicularis TaxID=375764 RepID=A0A673AA06_9TELE